MLEKLLLFLFFLIVHLPSLISFGKKFSISQTASPAKDDNSEYKTPDNMATKTTCIYNVRKREGTVTHLGYRLRGSSNSPGT